MRVEMGFDCRPISQHEYISSCVPSVTVGRDVVTAVEGRCPPWLRTRFVPSFHDATRPSLRSTKISDESCDLIASSHS